MSDAKPRAKSQSRFEFPILRRELKGGEAKGERSVALLPRRGQIVLLVSLRRGAPQGQPIDALVRKSHYERNSMHSYYGM